ncbi:MAG: heavy-metal-associated domain-containing protein [Thermoleophilia bacterium]|nr:heavy-metal-associated domain-containing protein [Thermoleophilia bacterium]
MSDSSTSTISLSVPDISCGHCKRAIEGALAGVPGITGAEVDVEARTVSLSAAGDDAVAAAVAAIEDAGYDVPGR